MKTPREILIAQYREIEPKLDAIRQSVTAAQGEEREQENSLLDRLAISCHEFLRVPRLAWVTFGAAWLAIIALNIASSETPRSSMTTATKPRKQSPEMLQALREQKRLFTELVGSVSAPDAEPPRFVPRPRSEREAPIAFA